MKNDKKSSLKSHSLKYNISLRAQTPDRFWTFLESQMLAFLIEKLFLIAPKQQLKFFFNSTNFRSYFIFWIFYAEFRLEFFLNIMNSIFYLIFSNFW